MQKAVDEIQVPAPTDFPATPDTDTAAEDTLTMVRLARACACFAIFFGIMMIPGCIERHGDAAARVLQSIPPEAVYFPSRFPDPQGPVQPHVDAF